MPKDAKHPRRPHRSNAVPGSSLQTFSLSALGLQAEDWITSSASQDDPVDAPMTSIVDVFDLNGKLSHRDALAIEPPSPVKQTRQAQIEKAHPPSELHDDDPPLEALPLVYEDEEYTMTLWPSEDSEPRAAVVSPDANKKTAPADPALAEWIKHRKQYLEIFLWFDGRGKLPPQMGCPRCGHEDRPATARCQDCAIGDLVCVGCCVDFHVEHPLHWIEIWTGSYFKRSSLKELGLRVQLGHPPRERCVNPVAACAEFVVLHTNGIHTVGLDFCGCHLRRDAAYHLQLLRRRWFPSTTAQPQSCATLACLETAHVLLLKAQTTLFHYYGCLELLTNGVGEKPPDRYRAFLRIMREYRHLMMLKRAGRGHEPGGIEATPIGGLAVICPVCPRPGVNIPNDWQRRVVDRYIYNQFVAIDACFRLKRGMVSNLIKDPPLGSGLAYFVEPEPYRQYLLSVTDQKEMSTCSGLKALDHANTKFSRGYSVTGVAMCICARHEFVLPNGVGDLQRGERYANIDYIFASAMRHISKLLPLVISYDIACQWSKSLRARLLLLPPLVRLQLAAAVAGFITFVIPKMHIKGHILLCQLLFSLYLALGAAQTDGEGIERLWSLSGRLSSSTKSSGPGSRSDQLDDYWGFWNWRKKLGLPSLMRRRLDSAEVELAKQKEAFETLSKEQKDRVPRWEAMLAAHEAPRAEDEPAPINPYKPTVEPLTEAEVRKKLEAQEAEEVANGKSRVSVVSASEFVAFGLEIEDQQRNLRVQAELKKAKSTAGKINLGKLRAQMRKGDSQVARAASDEQQRVGQLKQDEPEPELQLVENEPLFLGSGLTTAQRACCVASLHMKARLLVYKMVHSRHQAMNTRSRTLVNRNEAKIKLHVEKYRAARRALVVLLGNTPAAFPRLRQKDIRCMEDPEKPRKKREDRAKGSSSREVPLVSTNAVDGSDQSDQSDQSDDEDIEDDGQKKGGDGKKGSGESKHVMSWIWKSTGMAGSDAELEDGKPWSFKLIFSCLISTWQRCGSSGAKRRARKRRWEEQVNLLREEWRRLPQSLKDDAEAWSRRAAEARKRDEDPEVTEGGVAYAEKQAARHGDNSHRAKTSTRGSEAAFGAGGG
ncbi:hypothetical protein HMN09_00052600 [Mycena chlorophos]|uniref:CxC2-like cysteine cluster KDZ transposase-associated domain-containing protein n=1 Tax=Mycena chlorophos TaxID=658473 RepID=A0A8H6TU09_MYCCL|nr:hypothetical protein HMN09_00052600 [Mycena chlorophos]